MQNKDDIKWMKYALNKAYDAYMKKEVPVGAIIVKNRNILACGFNAIISNNDPTAHAEIEAIRLAAKKVGNYRLKGCVMYVTFEPCMMCLGAIIHARIDRVVYGAKDLNKGVLGGYINLSDLSCYNHKVSFTSGILEVESSNLLHKFFKERR